MNGKILRIIYVFHSTRSFSSVMVPWAKHQLQCGLQTISSGNNTNRWSWSRIRANILRKHDPVIASDLFLTLNFAQKTIGLDFMLKRLVLPGNTHVALQARWVGVAILSNTSLMSAGIRIFSSAVFCSTVVDLHRIIRALPIPARRRLYYRKHHQNLPF